MTRQSSTGTKPKTRTDSTAPVSKGLGSETIVKIRKVTGLVIGAFAVFTLIAVLSYLFSWKADQSLLTDSDMMSKSAEVSNYGGKIGFRWGHFLVDRCFGLGSIALIVLLFAGAVRFFFKEKRFSFSKAVILTLTACVISSIVLAFIGELAGLDTLFGGGLGGDCGALIVSWSNNLVGHLVTALLILILSVVWLLAASGRFSRWFINVGESSGRKKSRREKKSGASRPGDKTDDDEVPGDEAPEKETNKNEPNNGFPENETNEDEIGEDEVAEDEPFKTETPKVGTPEVITGGVESPSAGPEDGGSGQDVAGGMEIIDGPDITTEVEKELPRIDTREELSKYQFPPLDLLDDYADSRRDVPTEELERNSAKIKATLKNYKINIDDKVVACKGPTVTLYKVTPAPGVKISAIRNLEEDIALALGKKGVRVVTLPDVVGIEVPNSNPSKVPLKSLLNDETFRNTKYELPVAIGYTITQKVKVFDLTDAPHLLVAGATKQGKSVGLNVIIASLLYAKHPSELKLVFVDPKMVEFNEYSSLLKHYLAVLPTAANEDEERAEAIVKDAKKAELTLRSLVVEMDERYKLMSKSGTNNVVLYNNKYRDRHLLPTEGHRFLPYIVVVIDEYADLIMSGGMGPESRNQARSITTSIIRLAQKGRAAGIHVIIATQRPTVDVITGLIKTNFPMRIAFRTVSRVDSSTILDKPGAERLIGKGDMLFYAGVEMERMQCALIEMEEIKRITDFIGSQTGYKQCYNTPYYLPMPESEASEDGTNLVNMQELDDLFREAAEFVVQNQKGSTTMLQRRLGVGFARAGKIMDQLEAAGIVGPQDGAKPRQILVADFEELKPILDAFLK